MCLVCQVLETAHEVGMLSGSTRFDVPYMEMANQCEELSNGKQEKMSYLMNIQREEQNFPGTTSQNGFKEHKPVASHSQSDMGYQMVSSFPLACNLQSCMNFKLMCLPLSSKLSHPCGSKFQFIS